VNRTIPLALALVACGPSALQLPAHTTPALQGTSFARDISTFTDLDTVRDVAVGPRFVYVATDRGVILYPSEGPADGNRVTELPSVDVRAVSVNASGVATVATARGIVEMREGNASSALPTAPVGDVVALHHGDDGVRWVCGTEGLARMAASGWERFGEAMQCTGLFPTPEGSLWVGTTRGAWYLDQEGTIREHAEGRGLPAGWVRSIVPAQPGQAWALVQNTSESYFAWFDGHRWYGYTIPSFERPVVGLSRMGGDLVLVTPSWAFRVSDASTGSGVALRALTRGDRLQVLGYRARVLPASEVTPSEDEPTPPRGPMRMAAVPPNHPTIEAPGFVVAPLARVAENAYLVRTSGSAVHLADRNLGVSTLGAEGVARTLRSKDLVAARDLQAVSDERAQTWLLTDEGSIATLRRDGLVRVAAPAGTRPWALAKASRGVYLAATVPATPNLVRIYRRAGDEWQPIAERTLAFPEGRTLASTPILGMTDEEEVWLGLRVQAEGTTRARGVAVFQGAPPAEGSGVVYHHSTSEPAIDGEASLRMPDDFSNIDLNDPSMAWFSTIMGAVRVGNHQAVVFGEDRGVRGEVVSDVLVASNGRVWMAAAEGPGYRQGTAMEFRMPQEVKDARPLALALDSDGNVWGAGANGLVRYDGESWAVFGEDSGLPTTELVDVEGDASGRLWILARDRVLMLGPARAAAPAE